MQLKTLACDSCGAPVEVALDAALARCGHCGATQTVIRRPVAAQNAPRRLETVEERAARELAGIAREYDVHREVRELRKGREEPLTEERIWRVISAAPFVGLALAAYLASHLAFWPAAGVLSLCGLLGSWLLFALLRKRRRRRRIERRIERRPDFSNLTMP